MCYTIKSYRRENMKKEFGKLALLLSLITFGMPANASFWDLWKNEDEEPMSVSKTKQDDVYHNQKANIQKYGLPEEKGKFYTFPAVEPPDGSMTGKI